MKASHVARALRRDLDMAVPVVAILKPLPEISRNPSARIGIGHAVALPEGRPLLASPWGQRTISEPVYRAAAQGNLFRCYLAVNNVIHNLVHGRAFRRAIASPLRSFVACKCDCGEGADKRDSRRSSGLWRLAPIWRLGATLPKGMYPVCAESGRANGL